VLCAGRIEAKQRRPNRGLQPKTNDVSMGSGGVGRIWWPAKDGRPGGRLLDAGDLGRESYAEERENRGEGKNRAELEEGSMPNIYNKLLHGVALIFH